MGSLSHILLSAPDREGLVNDLARTLENHIAKMGGLKGMAAKAGYNTLKAGKPNIATGIMRRYLPDFATALDPYHAAFQQSRTGDFGQYLAANAEEAAAAVLEKIDARLKNLPPSPTLKMFQQFRGLSEKELAAVLPKIGQVMAAHL